FPLKDLVLPMEPCENLVTIIYTIAVSAIDHSIPFGKRTIVCPVSRCITVIEKTKTCFWRALWRNRHAIYIGEGIGSSIRFVIPCQKSARMGYKCTRSGDSFKICIQYHFVGIHILGFG